MALFFEDIEVGSSIPSLAKTPTHIQLFMFSAVTWNRHRIHYDADFARDHDGLPGVVAHRPLHGSFLAQLLTDWLKGDGRIKRLEWSNRGPAVAGDRLVCGGKVVRKYREAGKNLVECEVWIQKEGVTIVPGKAEVVLTSRKRDS